LKGTPYQEAFPSSTYSPGVASGGDCRRTDLELFEGLETPGAPDGRDGPPALVELPALGKFPGGLGEARWLHPDRVNTAASRIPAGIRPEIMEERHQQGANALLMRLPASSLIPHFSGIIDRDFMTRNKPAARNLTPIA
jgi:hypothetical protein